ncbi:hypothetical protein SERLA73DRAFT_158733 [Serpula lacrymans var. lacrymans S7.3]|uniref:Myb/SANT-like domain-containing protein n=2 Tax=Serpula lacrymans var. lacrymans TaxID=341189 RepID=F8PNF8_SERL3|nr:uncharacterized protein SERLADRAFT_434799 [Serpula lacrymans var. lacrymans S7.9]EGO03140.1 hypothetical protein SERLA73DRAFT_158733 [Serpula lacrymans var. lacrymans S7.3]EGO28907.1 hypothetical protein SERLADRAFT_434799 [Serpula lacrymans var. lacrymans S7.9]
MSKRKASSSGLKASLHNYKRPHYWLRAGNGLNFPKKFWTKAAIELQKIHQVSPAKEAEHCAGKWGRLRTTYQTVKALSEQSGFHWDNIAVQKKPGVKIFRNKGWTHFSAMEDLMCGHFAKGANIFYSAPPSVPVPNSPPVSSITPSSSMFPPPVAITPQTPRSINTNMHSHDANVNLWLGDVPSPKSMPAPSTLSSTASRGSSSSKQKEHDTELDANADADAMSVATRSKSTGMTVHSHSSKTPRVAANAMTATALTGLNDMLGQIVPIMKGITDTIRNEFDTPLTKQGSSSAVIPSSAPGTSTITPSSFISHYNFDITKQPSHIRRGIAIQALQELDHKLGIPKQVELLHIFEREIGAVDTYLNMLHATDLHRAWISSFTKV